MDIIKEIINSKKHLTAIVVILIIALNKKFGLELTDQDLKFIVATAGALILGQGAADFGKGKLIAEKKIADKEAKDFELREKIKAELREEIEG